MTVNDIERYTVNIMIEIHDMLTATFSLAFIVTIVKILRYKVARQDLVLSARYLV